MNLRASVKGMIRLRVCTEVRASWRSSGLQPSSGAEIHREPLSLDSVPSPMLVTVMLGKETWELTLPWGT